MPFISGMTNVFNKYMGIMTKKKIKINRNINLIACNSSKLTCGEKLLMLIFFPALFKRMIFLYNRAL